MYSNLCVLLSLLPRIIPFIFFAMMMMGIPLRAECVLVVFVHMKRVFAKEKQHLFEGETENA
jgi:hypothetical protein